MHWFCSIAEYIWFHALLSGLRKTSATCQRAKSDIIRHVEWCQIMTNNVEFCCDPLLFSPFALFWISSQPLFVNLGPFKLMDFHKNHVGGGIRCVLTYVGRKSWCCIQNTFFLLKEQRKNRVFSLIFRPMSGYFVIVSDHVSGSTPNYFEDVPRLILHTVI